MSDFLKLEDMVSRPRGRVLAEGWGYLIASAIALFADLSTFAILSWLGCAWYLAATGGFLLGAVVAYLISVRWVFATRSIESWQAELAIFILIGCLALLMIQGVMWVQINILGIPSGWARVVAAIFSFLTNFTLRKLALFRDRRVVAVESEQVA